VPRPKGLAKTGGRQKGASNHVTVAAFRRTVASNVASTVERVLAEYGHIGFLDIRTAFDKDGNLKTIQELPEDVARSIAGIEFEEIFAGGKAKVHVGRIHKIKLASKLGALDSIAKHLGMFVEKHRFVDASDNDVIVSVEYPPE